MTKRFFVLFILLLLLYGCGNKTPESQTGWNDSSQEVFYPDESVTPQTGWQTVDGSRYYFHPERGGAMVSGWLELPEGKFYFDSNGIMQTGWLELPEGRFYFDSSGIMQTGWLNLSGKQYYLRSDGTMAVGTVQIAGKDHHFTASGEPFLLINLKYGLPDDYQPDLVEIEGFWVSKDCAEALRAMMDACRAAGHRCVINTAYRDRDYQQVLWDNRYNNYISQGYSSSDATALTAQYVLPPGYSEHHTGLAVDITGTEEMYEWLEQYAPEYGFILRYPEDKTQWTGVSYEPWHFRYVGKDLALELQALGFTPEEYLHALTDTNHSNR